MSEPVRWIKAEAFLELDLVDGNILAQLVREGVVDSKTKENHDGEKTVYLKESDLLRATSAETLRPSTGIKSRAKSLAHDSFVATVSSAISALAVGSWLADHSPEDWRRQVFEAIASMEEKVESWRAEKRTLGIVGSRYDDPPTNEFHIDCNRGVMAPAIEVVAEIAGISLGHKNDPDPMPSILPRLKSEFSWSDEIVRRVLFSNQGNPRLDFRIVHGSELLFVNKNDLYTNYNFYHRKFVFDTFSRSSPFLRTLDANRFVDDYHRRFCEVIHVDTSLVGVNEDLRRMFYWNMLVLHVALEELSARF